jgi:hypothetical protein
MPETFNDPSSNTQAFQAWVYNQPTQPPPASRTRFIIGVAVAAIVILGLLGWLALS